MVAHSGAPELPIAKGASGGELSRVMLALEVVLADADPVSTMVFDEVDAGVGGLGRHRDRLPAGRARAEPSGHRGHPPCPGGGSRRPALRRRRHRFGPGRHLEPAPGRGSGAGRSSWPGCSAEPRAPPPGARPRPAAPAPAKPRPPVRGSPQPPTPARGSGPATARRATARRPRRAWKAAPAGTRKTPRAPRERPRTASASAVPAPGRLEVDHAAQHAFSGVSSACRCLSVMMNTVVSDVINTVVSDAAAPAPTHQCCAQAGPATCGDRRTWGAAYRGIRSRTVTIAP